MVPHQPTRQLRHNRASPAKRRQARGVPGFRDLQGGAAARSPLQRGVDADEVGGAAVFLAGDAAAGITGQTLYVDAGAAAVAWGPTV